MFHDEQFDFRGKKPRGAAARFFLGIARAAREPKRCEHTMPLFPLALIMDAEGLLAADARDQLFGGEPG